MRDLRVHILYSVGHQGCVEGLSVPAATDAREDREGRYSIYMFLVPRIQQMRFEAQVD